MTSPSPCLWFDTNAEEAVAFYCSVFRNSRILAVTRYGKNAPLPEGTVMTIKFELDGREFFGLNGGPVFTFNPSVSFVVYCSTQEDLDEMWHKLSDGGSEGQCGWLTDKYGLSWQIVPKIVEEMMTDPDSTKVQRLMKAMLNMNKINMIELEKAFYNYPFC